MIQPMLLHNAEENKPLYDQRYLSELKLDGIRLILIKKNLNIYLYTRHQVEVTSRFPELLNLDIPDNTILDGELIVTDNRGHPDFELMMKRFHCTRPSKVYQMSQTYPVSFVAFDLLRYENRWVTDLTLLERKMLLSYVIPNDNHTLSKVKYMEGKGPELFDAIKERDLEGIVQKDKHSKYLFGYRTNSWLKVINRQETTVYISGFRKEQIGWLLSFEDGSNAGIMELGIDPKSCAAFYEVANQNIISENNQFMFISPYAIKCRVEYRNLTSTGKLRLPIFNGFLF